MVLASSADRLSACGRESMTCALPDTPCAGHAKRVSTHCRVWHVREQGERQQQIQGETPSTICS